MTNASSSKTDFISSVSVFPFWFSSGAVAGLAAWKWGASALPTWLFQFAFGVSVPVLLLVLLLVAAFLVARSTWKVARLASNDFAQFAPWALARLQRGASALLGLATVAATAWLMSGSGNAGHLTLLSAMFIACLQWMAHGMQVLIATHAMSVQAIHRVD